ncbi:uncharacterized protein [Physcomitrium patens]|uniref:Uncharacterized protein n=1 Tax=Physcomitrium patens TaxID=3218 RepID=A9RF15_PHYPA|nr:hypothetical protein PHYPA_017208 [Physcomitrium patens]
MLDLLPALGQAWTYFEQLILFYIAPLTQYMITELEKHGIMVSAVARGFSKTDSLFASRSERGIQEASKEMSLHRWMHPVYELDALITFLVSDHGHSRTENVRIAGVEHFLSKPQVKSL